MRPIETGVVSILVAGNLLLFGSRCATADRSFDFESFRMIALDTFPESGLSEQQFIPNPMLADQHLYLEGAGRDPWFSVYAAYYPVHGLTEQRPHDLRMCYGVAEFDILDEEVVELRPDGHGEPLLVSRMLVENVGSDASVTSQRIVYYWNQSSGELPTQPPGQLSVIRRLPRSLLSLRSDLVSLRIEFLPPSSKPGLTAPPNTETVNRLFSIMRAAAASMR